MRINIGMRHGGGQLVLDTELSAETLRETLRDRDEVLDVEDAKGDRALVPVDSISYVLIPSEKESRVGFARL